MRVETQLSAFLENRAGVLAEMAADLARQGISIRALTVANLVDHAVVRLVVSEPQKALHLLGDRGGRQAPRPRGCQHRVRLRQRARGRRAGRDLRARLRPQEGARGAGAPRPSPAAMSAWSAAISPGAAQSRGPITCSTT